MASDHSTPAQTRSEPPRESELFMLAGLGAIVRWFEELFALLSGPVLTFGLGIALIDLLTDGKLLASIPALLFAWAASQAVGLDAQLVGSSAKLASAFRHRAVWPIIGYTLLVTALGIVAYQASNVFATQQADGITTAQALARLGMDSTSWLIERSVLAVFLVILSGLLRYVAPAQQQVSLEDERTQLERELALEPLRQRLRAEQVGGIRALAQTALTGHSANDASSTTATTATTGEQTKGAMSTETTPRLPAMPGGNGKLNNRSRREALAAAMYVQPSDGYGTRAHITSPRGPQDDDGYTLDDSDWASADYGSLNNLGADDFGAFNDDGPNFRMRQSSRSERALPARIAPRGAELTVREWQMPDLPPSKYERENDSDQRRAVFRVLDDALANDKSLSRDEVAALAGVSENTVRTARAIWDTLRAADKKRKKAAPKTREMPAVTPEMLTTTR